MKPGFGQGPVQRCCCDTSAVERYAGDQGFQRIGAWVPERAFDRKIVPEGTNMRAPVSAVMSGLPPPPRSISVSPMSHVLRSAFLQADSSDFFWIEGSLDGENFRPLPRCRACRAGSI
jgi:hypothetical protein